MKKKYILLIFTILSLLILSSKCYNDDNDNNQDDNQDDNEDFEEDDLDMNDLGDDYGYFKETLKNYLIESRLFNSDREISRNEMKAIFLEVISEGEPDRSPPYLIKVFDQLADYFIEEYYKENKVIRGRDIYELMDIEKIYSKFGDIVSESSFFDDFNEQEDDLDDKNSIIDDL